MTQPANEYVFPPAPASSDEVLAEEPNSAESATSGPDPQVSQTGYVTWTKPDGSSFVAALSNSETYERKGYKRGAEVDIPDLVAYVAEQASKEPPKVPEAKPAPTPPPTSKTEKS